MTTENEDFDAEAFAEEGMRDAGIEPEEQETAENEPSGVMSKTEKSEDEVVEKPAETDQTKETSTDEVKAALEATESEEAEEEIESSIADILPQSPESEKPEQEEKDDHRVPMEDHIKLRQRAQDAERKLEELTKQQQAGEERPAESEVSPLEQFVEENPEEELVPAKVQLDDRKWHEARQRRQYEAATKAEQAALEQQRAATQQLQDFKSKADKAESSEKEVRKAHPDYDAVTQAAVKAKLLDDTERDAIFNAENPADEYYKLCKGKIEAIGLGLGIPSTPTSKSNQPANEEQEEETDQEMTDDEIYDSVYSDE